MGDIKIAGAPEKFKSYLQIADANSEPKGKNGRIDTNDEAYAAADVYCRNHADDCESILQYLEGQNGFDLSQIRGSLEEKKVDKVNALIESLFSGKGGGAAVELMEIFNSGCSLKLRNRILDHFIQALDYKSGDARWSVMHILTALNYSLISLEIRSIIAESVVDGFENHSDEINRESIGSLSYVIYSGVEGRVLRKTANCLIRVLSFEPIAVSVTHNASSVQADQEEAIPILLYIYEHTHDSGILSRMTEPLISIYNHNSYAPGGSIYRLAKKTLGAIAKSDVSPEIRSMINKALEKNR